MIPFRLTCLALPLALAACQPLPSGPERPTIGAEAPPGAPPGTCWGKKDTPAMIETVTEQVQLTPAETDATGQILRPAAYATVTRQAILRERVTTWYETPCADLLTPEFIASVQRALAARGLYTGPVTARLDPGTRAAIARYQAPLGLDSDMLSLDSARRLGLVATPLND
ncbi:MAG: peptidoglycan-binding domain-containing protein [Roseovarius sp.]